MKHTLELRVKDLMEERSSQLFTQLKQLQNESLKKIQARTGIEPMTSVMPVLYQLSYQANWELVIL